MGITVGALRKAATRKMKHQLAPLKGLLQGETIGKRDRYERKIGMGLCAWHYQPWQMTTQRLDPIASGQQTIHEMGANEATGPSHNGLHEAGSSTFRS